MLPWSAVLSLVAPLALALVMAMLVETLWDIVRGRRTARNRTDGGPRDGYGV